MRRKGFLCVGMAFMIVSAALGQTVPEAINYQGRLNDSLGDAVDQTVSMLFRVTDKEVDDAEVLDEPHTLSGTDPQSLAHDDVLPGSETVTDTGGSTTYTAGLDYLVVYPAGTLQRIDGGGIPDPGDVLVDYIYDTDLQVLWSETQSVEVNEGLFNVVLGSVNPIQATVFLAPERFLEINVDGEMLEPRTPLESVAYALAAEDAHTLNGQEASEFGDGHSLDAVDGSPVDMVFVDAMGRVGIGEMSPATTLDVNGGISADKGNSAMWNEAHSWGDHALAGYLTTEVDPVFGASPASGISSGQISDWEDAYTWGDHSTVGYLKTESDPIFAASPASGISSGQISDWEDAYDWGDHASAGYDTTDDSWTGVGDVSVTTGNVGIGDSSPGDILYVNDFSSATDGSDGCFVQLHNSNLSSGVTTGLRFQNGTTADTIKGAIFYHDVASYGRGDMVFANNDVAGGANVTLSDARMTIQSDGDVGIGTTDPQDKLHVDGNVRIPSAGGAIKNTDGREILETWWSSQFGDYTAVNSGYDWQAGDEPVSMVAGANGVFFTVGDGSFNPYGETLMKIETDGDVGIGTTSPSTSLDENGQIRMRGGSPGDGKVMVSDSNGVGEWRQAHAFSFLYVDHADFDVSDTWASLVAVGTFTKNHDESLVEISYHGRVSVTALVGLTLEVRIDGAPPVDGYARQGFSQCINEQFSIHAMFSGLSSGSHTVSLWARAIPPTSADITLNPVGWTGCDQIMIKEIWGE